MKASLTILILITASIGKSQPFSIEETENLVAIVDDVKNGILKYEKDLTTDTKEWKDFYQFDRAPDRPTRLFILRGNYQRNDILKIDAYARIRDEFHNTKYWFLNHKLIFISALHVKGAKSVTADFFYDGEGNLLQIKCPQYDEPPDDQLLRQYALKYIKAALAVH